MADPHLLLPTSSDLVRAFIADLANVLDLEFGSAKPTLQKTLWCASATATLTADRDYTIVGVTPLQVGAFVLAAAPTTIANVTLANNASFDVIAANSSTTSLPAFVGIRWVWKALTKIYLVSTVGVGIVLTLEP